MMINNQFLFGFPYILHSHCLIVGHFSSAWKSSNIKMGPALGNPRKMIDKWWGKPHRSVGLQRRAATDSNPNVFPIIGAHHNSS